MNTARKTRERLLAVAAATLIALYVGIVEPAQSAFAGTFRPIIDGMHHGTHMVPPSVLHAGHGRRRGIHAHPVHRRPAGHRHAAARRGHRGHHHQPPPPACHRRSATHCATAVHTAMTLTASPNPATAGQAVTLTAVVTPASGTATPTGAVRFEADGTAIGPPVVVDSSGVATTTTTFATAGTDGLSAVFTPANATAFKGSTASLSLSVVAAQLSSGAIPLATTVPVAGTFTLTVDTTDIVTLAVSGNSATAATTPIVVSDTRNTYPGWSVSGQAADFTGPGAAAGSFISGNQLGWTPSGSSLAPGVTLGGPVTPASPGLGTGPGSLAFAHAGSGGGFGTSTLGADLTLAIPAEAEAGSYSSSLNMTAVTALP